MEKPVHIRSLTSLRGIAAVAIVVLHFSYYTLPSMGKILSTYTHFFQNAYLWVDFFFILSGFIMTHVYLDRFKSGVNFAEYRSYLFSRFARIYPLHLFTLLLLISLELIKLFSLNTPAFTNKFNLTALFANITLLQAFDLNCPPLFWCDTYWNEPAWSISVEFVVYCIFPFLLLALTTISPKFEPIVYVITLVTIFLLIKFTRGSLDSIIGIPAIARCSLESTLGIIIYKVYQRGNYHKYWNLNLLGIGALVWIGLVLHHGVDRFRSLSDWLILPGFSVLILAVAVNNYGSISRLLNSRLLLYLGTISYSIYLVHWPIAELLKIVWQNELNLTFGSGFNDLQVSIALSGFILTTIFTASLTYQFIEVPMRNYLKGVSQL
jgi:peptidoglycan/LPS O-acetylase OafA/YrhL